MSSKSYQLILYSTEAQVARIYFNRPEVHNAFNAGLIREVGEAVEKAWQDENVRVVVFSGTGKSFCAGADLNWMREVVHFSFEQNLQESLAIAEVMHKIYTLPKPTIARVNGAAIGGGNGFLSACDIVVASEEAKFGLSEVKLGLVPAAISPYVILRIGEGRAREYFLTGERISAQRAYEIGLANRVVPADKLDETVNAIVSSLLSSGPHALASCKELIQQAARISFEEAKQYTARMIAQLRISPEGQEGMSAFLEKRKPKWVKDV